MSWSFTLILCGTASPEPLIRECTHRPDKAAQILRDLGFDAREQSRPILNDALGGLEPNYIGVGAYKDIILFSDPSWLLGANDAEVFNSVQQATSIPTRQVLYVQLAGVVSYQCYAYCIDGRLVRRFEADGERVIDSIGDFLPVEQALFTADGMQEELTDDLMGELPFAMMSIFYGADYGNFPGDEAIASIFRVKRRSSGRFWSRPRR